MRRKIAVHELEFEEGGNTVWVHGRAGATILRIKCSGKITVSKGCESPVPHSDAFVQGDIHVCMPGQKLTERGLLKMERDLDEKFCWIRHSCDNWEDPMGASFGHHPTTQAHAIASQRLKPRARK